MPGQTKTSKQAKKWIEDKIDVRVGKPYLNQDKNYLVLVYTVTNKTGADIRLDWSEDRSELRESIEMMMQEGLDKKDRILSKSAKVTVFYKLKEPPSYSEVSPKNSELTLADRLLPADLPVRFAILVRIPRGGKSSWFSSDKTRLRNALYHALGNTESIVVFAPVQRLKITFPISKEP
jgi:hypothetical protein